ncbi:MAG: hypothetical protein ACKO9H_18575, partial [Planctomycetota bacterium]
MLDFWWLIVIDQHCLALINPSQLTRKDLFGLKSKSDATKSVKQEKPKQEAYNSASEPSMAELLQ